MHNPYQPPEHNSEETNWSIGGLLWILAIEIVLAPFAQTLDAYTALAIIAGESHVAMPIEQTIFSLVLGIAGMAAALYLAQRFFQRHHLFPTRYIQLTGIMMTLMIYQWLYIPPPDVQAFTGDEVHGILLMSCLWYIGWGIYLTQTERSKHTFVRT